MLTKLNTTACDIQHNLAIRNFSCSAHINEIFAADMQVAEGKFWHEKPTSCVGKCGAESGKTERTNLVELGY